MSGFSSTSVPNPVGQEGYLGVPTTGDNPSIGGESMVYEVQDLQMTNSGSGLSGDSCSGCCLAMGCADCGDGGGCGDCSDCRGQIVCN